MSLTTKEIAEMQARSTAYIRYQEEYKKLAVDYLISMHILKKVWLMTHGTEKFKGCNCVICSSGVLKSQGFLEKEKI